ncbi:TIGR04141 family sporadically distributed protein [Myxococcus sp. K38C18041901]|uniref:DUF6119 family protein n=1 Tax=Myxococcus guangdongensis TaxID=2906760 RepID=UPI0020A7AEAB|nr:DUF6119 family protein [Myxococcus guangdongensis]MCP3060136.1 TIGR04141 family sporadically distributed protein [Myxococcus guangdongensis]
MKLNITLFSKEIQDFDSCLRKSSPSRLPKSIRSNKKLPGAEYDIYLLKAQPNPPKWLPFIHAHVQPGAVADIANAANSALILLKVETPEGLRIFAIAIGHGHHLINKDVIEPQFGLLTTLNGVDPERLKLVDSKRIGVQTLQKREASNLETKLADFDFEFDAELLHIVSGACADEKLGTRIRGSDSLLLTSKLDFEALPEKCLSIHKTFREDTYQKKFSFIDHIKPEKSARTLDKLDSKLVEALNQRLTTAKLSVAYPDQIDYEANSHYVLQGRGSHREFNEVTLPALYDYLGDDEVEFADLKKIRITGIEVDSGAMRQTAAEPLHAYLTYEVDLDGIKFVLCNRKWYRISNDYLDQIQQELATLILPSETPGLKPWHQTLNKKEKLTHIEGDYNIQYKQDADFLYMDKELFTFGPGLGHSKIEIADLFHRPSKKLFCVKRLNDSATLSHLFSQATVSADLFRQHAPYRDKFVTEVTRQWPSQTFSHEDIDSLRFVYALGTERTEPLLEILPIFSKVMLLKHARMLQRTRFKVEIARVEMKPGTAPAAPAVTFPRRRRKQQTTTSQSSP